MQAALAAVSAGNQSAEQAALVNAGYRANALPVTPAIAPSPQETDYSGYSPAQRRALYNSGNENNLIVVYNTSGLSDSRNQYGVAEYLTPSEYQNRFGYSGAQYENMKYNVFNNPGAIQNPNALPPDLQASYKNELIQNVHEYYRQNPSPEFLAIIGQYAAQQNRVVGGGGVMYQGAPARGSNPYRSDTALGIAWEVGSNGGATDTRMNQIALGEADFLNRSYGAGIDTSFITYATNQYIERPRFDETIQTDKYGKQYVQQPWAGAPIRQNITLGEMAGMDLSKIPADFALETGIHTAQGDWGGGYNYDFGKQVQEAPDRLTGTKTLAAMGFDIIDDPTTMKTYVPYGSYDQIGLENTKLAINRYTGEVAIYQKNAIWGTWDLIGGGGRNALQSGMFSVGSPLTPYVTSQWDVGTYETSGSKFGDSPRGVSKLGAERYGGFVRPLSNENLLAPNSQISRYYGAGEINLANLVEPVAWGKSEAPGSDIPWSIQPGSPAIQYMDTRGIIPGSAVAVPAASYQSDRLIGGKTVASVGAVSDRELPAPFMSTSSPEERSGAPGFSKYDQAILGGYSGGLIGYALWGEKSPEVIKGGIGSVIDFFPAMVGWTPVADRMRVTDPGQADYIAGMGARSSEVKGLSEQGAAKYGVDSQGKILIDSTNPEAVAFQARYESARTGYTDYMKSGVEKGYTKYQGGSLIVNPDLTYDYGEYSKWGAGAGSAIREKLGFSKEQLDTYGMQVESRQGLQYIPEKIVYGTGYTLSTRPEKILTAYGAAIVTMGAGEVYGTIMQTPRIAAATAAFGTAHPTAAAIGAGIMHYGVPTVMLGATYYGVSEGLTATPERTTVNIGKVLPELGGFMYGGMTGYAALRAADAGYVGFRTTEIKADVFEGEQPKIIPKLQEIQRSGVLNVGEPERAYIFNLQSGKLESIITGERGMVSPYSELMKLPEGGRYGVYHTHTNVPGVFDILKENVGLARSGEISFGDAAAYTYDFLKNRSEYTAGGGLPSPGDIVSSRGITSEFKTQFGIHSGVVEEGVISSEGINIYSRNRITRPLSEIYETPEAMGKAFINAKIPEEDLFGGYSSGRRKFGSTEQPRTLDIAERPLTGKEALEGKPLGIVDLTADQSWRYGIPQTTPAVEPYIIVGKIRAPVSEIKTTPDLGKINLIPSEEINPLTRVMTSEKNINPFEQARARGVAGPGEYERATSAKFSIDKLAEDMGLYSQKPSPQTAIFWERRQLETWGDPAKVPGIEYKPSPTESLRADMILTGENPAGVGAMSWGNPALPSPFPDEISIGSPRTPKGIGRTTDTGFGYGGSPMSGQMLEMVVTKGPIKTQTSYKSAMDVVIGQKATAARMKPVTEAAVRENILPSATEKTFTKPVKFDGFEEVLTGVLEGNKRTPAETSAGKSFRYKGVQIDYLRDAMRQRKGTFAFEQEQPKSASKSSKKNVATWFSKQQQRSVSRVSAQPAVKLPAQTPINIPQQSVSQSPMQAQVQPSMQSQIPIQTVVRTQVQLQPQINPQISRNPQIPVQQNGPGNRQQQNPFSGTIQQPAPIVTPIQSPRTAPQQVTRQVVDTPFAPFPIPPTRPVSEKPFAPTTPVPYIPTPRIPGPIVPTGGGGGGGGSHWIRGWETDEPPPPPPPIGLPWGGAGGEAPSSRKRRSAFVETFNMGLDMGFLGRKGRAAKSFITPASKKRKPVTKSAPKVSSKKSTSRKRK